MKYIIAILIYAAAFVFVVRFMIVCTKYDHGKKTGKNEEGET